MSCMQQHRNFSLGSRIQKTFRKRRGVAVKEIAGLGFIMEGAKQAHKVRKRRTENREL